MERKNKDIAGVAILSISANIFIGVDQFASTLWPAWADLTREVFLLRSLLSCF